MCVAEPEGGGWSWFLRAALLETEVSTSTHSQDPHIVRVTRSTALPARSPLVLHFRQ